MDCYFDIKYTYNTKTKKFQAYATIGSMCLVGNGSSLNEAIQELEELILTKAYE
jgi:hypothetical protein